MPSIRLRAGVVLVVLVCVAAGGLVHQRRRGEPSEEAKRLASSLRAQPAGPEAVDSVQPELALPAVTPQENPEKPEQPKNEGKSVHVALPARASAPAHAKETETHVATDVAPAGARDIPVQAVDHHTVSPRAYAPGATIQQRATATSTAGHLDPALQAAAARLTPARLSHAATLISSGNVLAAGGLTNTAVPKNAAISNPATGIGTSLGPSTNISTGRPPQTATLLGKSNSKTRIAGRNSGEKSSAQSLLFFDTTTYVPITDLGVPGAASTASDINNRGDIIGVDGNGAFTLTASGDINYVPWSGAFVYPYALNDSGVISGWAGFADGVPLSFRYDPSSNAQPVNQPGAGQGFGINSNGTATGGGYYPIAAWGGYAGVQMFRVDTGDVEVLPSIAGFDPQAAGYGIDADGTVVGSQLVSEANETWAAVRYSNSRGTEFLNGFVPVEKGWNLTASYYIRPGQLPSGVTYDEILGNGIVNGLPRSFRLRVTPDGEFVSIDDLGISPMYAPDAPNVIIPNRENSSGEIVGAIYDPWQDAPIDAFVYTDATGMVDLTSLVDPSLGWHLILAAGINDSREVVGYGTLGGVTRAFKLTLPDINLSTCPPPDPNSCHLQGQRNFSTGECSTPLATDGTFCTDGNACTQTDACLAGVCTGSNPVTCAGADQCRSAGVCDPATGVCTTALADNGQLCDDGNGCTVIDTCQFGACIPGDATGCSDGAPHFVSAIDIGSAQGGSQARDINNNGEVIGNDGNLGFTWTAKGEMTYIPWSGVALLPYALNDSGVMSGWAAFAGGPGLAFRYDPRTDPQPVNQPGAGQGFGINSGGTLTGGEYVTDLRMITIDSSGTVQTLPSAPDGDPQAVGYGIDANGTVVGSQLVSEANGLWAAVLYSESSGTTQDLNELLPNNLPADETGWNLTGGTYIRSSQGTDGVAYDEILGNGIHNTLPRSFRMKVSAAGDFMGIEDLGISPEYATDSPNTVVASRENAAGIVVGTIYDPWVEIPQDAFVYSDATGMVNLTDLLDPVDLKWHLMAANGINDSNQVVGWGYYEGVLRAFQLTLPVVTPCPPPADSCHTQGLRNLLTGTCSNPPVTDNVACTALVPILLGVAQEGPVFKAIFDYQSTSPTPVNIPYGSTNGLSDDGGPIASPPEMPPTTFVSTPHAPFVATLSGSQLTWTLGLNSVKATPPQLPDSGLSVTTLGDGTHDVVLLDGRLVNLDSTPPPAPGAPAPPPQVGPAFNGVIPAQFAISPSGAATYTVPISIPPGIGGMAPNLALSYNSQAGDGIAGPGWSLSGLSAITRCPRTRQQDGYGRPVLLDSLNASETKDKLSDGICLDGGKLLDQPSGTANCQVSGSVAMCYAAEKVDFNTISRNSTGEFQVTTKAGETRYYGLDPADRVTAANGASSGETAVWQLDRVVDAWGNYFDFHYNHGNGNNATSPEAFGQSGIWVSEIDYTGSLAAPQTTPFNTISFGYLPQNRPDVRWTTFGVLRIPQTQLLQTITTPAGQYTLTYTGNELQTVDYSASNVPMQQLKFGWKSTGGGTWHPSNDYTLPQSIVPKGKGLKGTQFVDLNGDGLPDFVAARTKGPNGAPQLATLINTGSGWSQELAANRTFPAYLSDQNDNPTSVILTDIDGDGFVDVVVDSANVTCDSDSCVTCIPGQDPNNGGCRGSYHGYSPAVFLNRFSQKDGGWEFHPEYGTIPSDDPNNSLEWNNGILFSGSEPVTMADMNGDGKADLVRVGENINSFTSVDILFAGDPGASPPWRSKHLDPQTQFNGGFKLQDANRDGLPDLVSTGYYALPDGTVYADGAFLPNTSDGVTTSFGPLIPRYSTSSGGVNISPSDDRPGQVGDVNGDGFYDFISYYNANGLYGNTNPAAIVAGVGFGDGSGFGFDDASTAPYIQALHTFSPPESTTRSDAFQSTGIIPLDNVFALVDINGDGLADFVQNHQGRVTGAAPGQVSGGQIFLNTGTTWQPVNGSTSWQISAGPDAIPGVIPGEATKEFGSAFIDLNGDGLPDLIQVDDNASYLATLGTTLGGALTVVEPDAWLNPYKPALIDHFPNGLAKPTVVTYNSTTGSGRPYADDDVTDPNTKQLALPLNVVSSVLAEDGTGTGTTFTTSYMYHSMRQDSYGRGPLGFHRVDVTDGASHVRTSTTYAQAYPYTGLPIEVDKYQERADGLATYFTNKTTTTYCDNTVPNTPFGCGTYPRGEWPANSPVFVFPFDVVDVAYIHSVLNDKTNGITIESKFTYDTQGNVSETKTTSTRLDGNTNEVFSKDMVNTFTTSEEQLEGKPERTVITSTGGTRPTTHTTSFEYATVGTFGGLSSSRLVMTKTHLEPDADYPIRLDTATSYDQLGNVTAATSCASDFGSCVPGGINPSSQNDPQNHPPFRTTFTSYDPSTLGIPVAYGPGRFPVKTADPAGHLVTTVYDPILGEVVTRKDPNGIETCFSYDPSGRLTLEIDRCNSQTPLRTTKQYALAGASQAGTPPNSASVTIATPPDGAPTWTYSDDQGKTTGSMAYAFDGGFVETTTAYNELGQVTSVAKPFHIATATDQPPPQFTHTETGYDYFNRVAAISEYLGTIDSSGGFGKVATVQMSYDGTSVTTTHLDSMLAVKGKTVETKNALGKVSEVQTLTGDGSSTPVLVPSFYQYDADGNLTIMTDPSGNQVLASYDTRGRKQGTTDPDMGTWKYVVDGFGDLVQEIDPNSLSMDPQAKGTTMTYDPLARVLTKTDSAGTAQWVYDVAPGAGIGQVAAMVSPSDGRFKGACTGIPSLPQGTAVDLDGSRATRAFQYTSSGDLEEAFECVDGKTFTTSYQYDSMGRQSEIRYPMVGSRQLAVGYHYTSLGQLQYLTDDSGDYSILWQAMAMNAIGQVTDEQMRNGVETASTRNPYTGWLLGSSATAHSDGDNVIQNGSYGFDEMGNLVTRGPTDAAGGQVPSETFTYDLTNRLMQAVTTTGAGTNTASYAYDSASLGNLTQKDGNLYAYGTGCSAGNRVAGPHAACSGGGGPQFLYDNNGNLTKGAGRSLTYNPSNKVLHIDSDPVPSQGNDTGSVDFIYGADGNRVVQSVVNGEGTTRTVYVGLGATGKSLYEETTVGTDVESAHFIYAGGVHGGSPFALRVIDQSTGAVTNHYYSFDHIGSVTAVSDDEGRVATLGQNATVLGYDAWGARRNPDGTSATPASLGLPPGNREFTGQEQIPVVELVNMNGRLYDPSLGRFMSPDPNVQSVTDLQSYNRYSYVRNNPLSYTDPTGFFWSKLGGFFENYFSNPLSDFELGVSIFACASSGVGCMLVGLEMAALNTAVAITNGAGFERTLVTTGIGLGIGIATGGLNQYYGGDALTGLLLGSESAAATSAISTLAMGQEVSGYDVLGTALLSAAQGAAALGLHQLVVSVSQASAAEAQAKNQKVVDDLAKARRLMTDGEIGRASYEYITAMKDAAAANAADPELGPAVSFGGKVEMEVDLRNENQRWDADNDWGHTAPAAGGGYKITMPLKTFDQGAEFLRATMFHEYLHIYFAGLYGWTMGRQKLVDEVTVSGIEEQYYSHFGLTPAMIPAGVAGSAGARAALSEYDSLHLH